MSEEQLKEIYCTFNESWKLIRKYSNQKQDDEFWDKFVDETSELVRKHHSSQFAKNIVFAVLDVMSKPESSKVETN